MTGVLLREGAGLNTAEQVGGKPLRYSGWGVETANNSGAMVWG